MSRKNKQDNTQKEDHAMEPEARYLPRSKPLSKIFSDITISTLEQQEEEMRKYSAALSPIERMAYLQDLIKIAYAHVLNNPGENLWDKKIYIDHRT